MIMIVEVALKKLRSATTHKNSSQFRLELSPNVRWMLDTRDFYDVPVKR
jgi:hypothetical protein